jgi:uncharacterized protein YndB with AHSA1/START domain
MTETFALEVERVIPGSIDKVFDAWLDPDQLKRWMTPGPGMSAPRVTVDQSVNRPTQELCEYAIADAYCGCRFFAYR